jgi:hypothetical protein
MKFKRGVDLNGIKSECIHAMCEVDNCYKDFGEELVITSVMDGQHGKNSLHYQGYAFDCRTRYFTLEEQEHVARLLRIYLGDNFDVVLESDHMHIEFDPV